MKPTHFGFGITAAIALAFTGTAAPASAGLGTTPAITWSPCPQNVAMQCGTVAVPVDWANPHGPKIHLSVARRPAGDPAARIGALLFDFGGPSGSGVDAVLSAGDRLFSDEVRRRFDIVGMDARGVGRSKPVLCSGPLLANQPYPVAANDFELDQIRAYNQARRADCKARTGPVYDHVDTLSVVRDLDVIRAALREQKLTFYGLSYGTLIGTQYAEQFPHRVRAIVADSLLDHSLDTGGLLDAGAVTAQDSFDEFVAWCGREPACALHGRDLRLLLASLIARTERGEIPFPTHPSDPPRPPLRPGELLAVVAGLTRGPDWSELALIMLFLDNGTPIPVSPNDPVPDVVADPTAAIRCGDWHLPLRDHARLEGHLARSRELAADMRYSAQRVAFVSDCLGLPASIPNPQHRLRVRTSAPLLLVNALHDPATGYNMATNVAQQLGRHATLLTYEGWGHGVYGRSECADSTIDRYLISLRLPSPGTRCPAVSPDAPSRATTAVTWPITGPGSPMPIRRY